MMSRLDEVFGEVIRLLEKEENQEFALFYDEREGGWTARAVNESRAVRLGESEGLYEASGQSAIEAMTNLADDLRKQKRRP
jgi:hypothetical protein